MNIDHNRNVDQIYYNVRIGGDKDIPQPAIFSINRVDTILDTPSDFVINIDEFTLPLLSIPLFQFFEAQYTITLEYNGTSVSKDLIYIPTGQGPGVPVNEGPVYSYYSQIQSYNIALQSAFADLQILEPLIPATTAPYVTLENNLLSINAEVAYESNLPNPIKIIFNKNCAVQYTNLPQFFITPDSIQFFIQNLYTNTFTQGPLTYYKMTQSQIGIQTWGKLNRILFETATIPVNRELVGTQTDVQVQILSDFNIEQDQNQPIDLTFQPKGPIRISGLISDYPLKQIDINLRWFSDDGTSSIIILPVGRTATIKLRFTRKSTLYLENIDQKGVNYA